MSPTRGWGWRSGSAQGSQAFRRDDRNARHCYRAFLYFRSMGLLAESHFVGVFSHVGFEVESKFLGDLPPGGLTLFAHLLLFFRAELAGAQLLRSIPHAARVVLQVGFLFVAAD